MLRKSLCVEDFRSFYCLWFCSNVAFIRSNFLSRYAPYFKQVCTLSQKYFWPWALKPFRNTFSYAILYKWECFQFHSVKLELLPLVNWRAVCRFFCVWAREIPIQSYCNFLKTEAYGLKFFWYNHFMHLLDWEGCLLSFRQAVVDKLQKATFFRHISSWSYFLHWNLFDCQSKSLMFVIYILRVLRTHSFHFTTVLSPLFWS